MSQKRFESEQVEAKTTKGLRSELLYRRIETGLSYPCCVCYPPALEEEVEDVRAYIAEELNLRSALASRGIVCAEFWEGPIEIGLPSEKPLRWEG